MNKYAVTEETLNMILQYLGTRPYVEVATIIDHIRTSEGLSLEISEPKQDEPEAESAE